MSPRIDAFARLRAEHRDILALIDGIIDRPRKDEEGRARGYEALERTVRAHLALEEHVLYPALQKIAAVREMVREGYEEHYLTTIVLGELCSGTPDAEPRGAKLAALRAHLERHVQEEELTLLPVAERAMDTSQLHVLGRALEEFRAPVRATVDSRSSAT